MTKFERCFSLSLISISVLSDKIDVGTHLELGKKFLQEGQLSDALLHYSAACGKHTFIRVHLAGV